MGKNIMVQPFYLRSFSRFFQLGWIFGESLKNVWDDHASRFERYGRERCLCICSMRNKPNWMPLGLVVIFVVPAKYFGQWCSLYHLGLFERVRCLLISLVSSTKIDNEMVFDVAAIWNIPTIGLSIYPSP